MEEIREKLGNLESVYARLRQIETLLNLLANNYFNMNKVDRHNSEDVLKLTWEYSTYQDVLFVSQDILYEQLKNLNENLYGIYNDLKNKNNQ